MSSGGTLLLQLSIWGVNKGIYQDTGRTIYTIKIVLTTMREREMG
jgi:hypothetical protein